MRILHVHNRYRIYGGEDRMFDATTDLLRRKGHEVVLFERSSKEIWRVSGRVKAFTSGIYSMESRRRLAAVLRSQKPDVVHIHNLFPFISTSILPACRRAGVPVVIRCPNYRLICPTGLQMRKSATCELCVGGREYWCFLTNCRGNLTESLGYALRSAFYRMLRHFTDNINCYLPPSQFVKRKLVEAGFSASKIVVLPNMVCIPRSVARAETGAYVGYVGSLHTHKGIGILLAAARLCPNCTFRIAGDGPLRARIAANLPRNVSLAGRLQGEELARFYREALMLALPSLCPETFGLVAAEAMSYSLPVIGSRVGGLPEVVDDHVTGYLVEPGSPVELADKIDLLWQNPSLCKQMGAAGREKAADKYSAEPYYERLLSIYHRVTRRPQPIESALTPAVSIVTSEKSLEE